MMEHTPQMTAQSGLAFAVADDDVGKGEKILSLFREEHALLDYVCMAHGTARTEMLDLLGIGETAKAVVFCLAASGQAQRILNRLGKSCRCATRDAVSRSPFRSAALDAAGTAC